MIAARPLDAGLRKRVAKGFAAQGLGQILTLMVQVGSVPLFLRAWGATAYGEWLLLSSVYLYLSLADLGFGVAAANEMAMRMGRGERERVTEVYQSAWAALCAISSTVFAVALALVVTLPLGTMLHLQSVGLGELRLTLGLLLANAILAQQGAMFEAAYRCDGLFARGIGARNAQRLAEFGVTLAVLVLGGGMAVLALAMLLSRAAVYAVTLLDLKRQVPWLRLGLDEARYGVARPLLGPALAATAFPVGQAVGGQGALTLAGALFGPSAVVLVSTVRTLARAAQGAIKGMAEALFPEFSRALGGGDRLLARRLHSRAVLFALAASGLAALATLLLGPRAFHAWTGGRLPLDPWLLALFVGATLPAGVWGASSGVPLATNRHGRIASAFVLFSLGTLVVAALLAPWVGIRAIALGALFGEIAMAAVVLRTSNRMLRESPAA